MHHPYIYDPVPTGLNVFPQQIASIPFQQMYVLKCRVGAKYHIDSSQNRLREI